MIYKKKKKLSRHSTILSSAVREAMGRTRKEATVGPESNGGARK
jgi:hypothetical protein